MRLRLLRLLPEPVRRVVYRHLPDAIWCQLQRAVGYREGPVDARPLQRIGTESRDRLGDPAFLTDDLLPGMGLTTHAAPKLLPAHLSGRIGRGVQAIQFPNQFGPYLAAMTRSGIRSYVEIGLELGGSFAITVEILRRFGLRVAIGVDLERPALMRLWQRPEATIVQMDSHSPEFAALVSARAPIDLAFIDGDHSEEGVRQDFEVLRPHTRILAFHDIVQEYGFAAVGHVWRSIREEYASQYEFCEFAAQYPELLGPRLGIGVAIRRDAQVSPVIA